MRHRLVTAALATAALAVAGAAQAQPQHIPLDQTTNIGGAEVGCTGIGQTKNDPRWLDFPERVEFARANGNYLASEVLTVSGPGASFSVSCEGPWIVLRLPAGAYRLVGSSTEADTASVTQTVSVPGHGQARIIMTIPGSH